MTDYTEISNKGPLLGARHVQTLLLFLCFVVNITDRLKASVTVFAMTDGALPNNSSFPQFEWNEKQQGNILSSFYWGILLTQFIGSLMCRKYGARLTILISTLGSAILNLLTPFLIHLGNWQIYTAILAVQGMFQGLFEPCIHKHIAKWSPNKERIRLGGFAHSGIEMATILAMEVPGFIAQSSWGWPVISYVSGGMSIVWCIFWAIFADDSPSVSRFISPEEKDFILNSQKKSSDENTKQIPIPWRALLTSVPFISLITIESAQVFGFQTVQNKEPSFLNGTLHLNNKSNSLFSALPYLGRFVVSNLCLVLGDLVIKKNIMSPSKLRMAVSTISTWIPAVTLLLVGFLPFDEQQKMLVIALMTLTVAINGGKHIGSGLNAIDLSPNHAATLIGIIKTACSAVSLATPLFVAKIGGLGTDGSELQYVFGITAAVLFSSNLQYLFFGKSNAQPWDDSDFGLTSSNVTAMEESNVQACENGDVGLPSSSNANVSTIEGTKKAKCIPGYRRKRSCEACKHTRAKVATS